MNEQTTKMIEELSQKLGTTVQHLWGVLVKQAPIDSTVDIFVLTLWLYFQIRLLKVIRRKTEGRSPEWDEKLPPYIFWFATAGFLFLSFTYNINLIVAGFVNPEYWALKQILK